jgi:hypothetical protein
MLLNKKLYNYKNKIFPDEFLDDNVIVKSELNTHTISYDDFLLNYNIVNNSIKLLSPINHNILISIKIIEDLIKLSKELNIKSIDIQDNSFVNIGSFQYDLSIYCILLTGYSFYTRYGFISVNHDEEYLYNKNIRNLPFNIFMNKIINENKFKKFFPEPYFNNSIKNIMKFINQYLEINNGKLKHNNPIILLLLEIIKKGKEHVKYNNKLNKNCL